MCDVRLHVVAIAYIIAIIAIDRITYYCMLSTYTRCSVRLQRTK